MIWHLGRSLKKEIEKLKYLGKKAGLPSLDAYSDKQIAEGFLQLRQSKENSLTRKLVFYKRK